ncbi:MAG: hypothetical protein ACOYEL_00630 [Saccharofermentanales bacterium]|jgi:hypothetical protein
MNSSKLKNKIQSNKGATLLFALVALIFCVMVAAVVIYTAFSNVGRVKNTQSEEQNYLSVSSAVKLFRNSLDGDSVSIEETLVVTTKETYDDNWKELISDPIISEETTFGEAVYNEVPLENTILQDVLKTWAKAIIDPPASQTNLTIAITGNSKLPQIATVEAIMDFNPANKRITITFGIKNAPSAAIDKYSTVTTMDLAKATSDPVTFSSEKKELIENKNVKTITVTKKVVHTISWDNIVTTKKKTGGG